MFPCTFWNIAFEKIDGKLQFKSKYNEKKNIFNFVETKQNTFFGIFSKRKRVGRLNEEEEAVSTVGIFPYSNKIK